MPGLLQMLLKGLSDRDKQQSNSLVLSQILPLILEVLIP